MPSCRGGMTGRCLPHCHPRCQHWGPHQIHLPRVQVTAAQGKTSKNASRSQGQQRSTQTLPHKTRRRVRLTQARRSPKHQHDTTARAPLPSTLHRVTNACAPPPSTLHRVTDYNTATTGVNDIPCCRGGGGGAESLEEYPELEALVRPPDLSMRAFSRSLNTA